MSYYCPIMSHYGLFMVGSSEPRIFFTINWSPDIFFLTFPAQPKSLNGGSTTQLDIAISTQIFIYMNLHTSVQSNTSISLVTCIAFRIHMSAVSTDNCTKVLLQSVIYMQYYGTSIMPPPNRLEPNFFCLDCPSVPLAVTFICRDKY